MNIKSLFSAAPALLGRVQFKNDKAMYAYAAALTVAVSVAVFYFHAITWQVGYGGLIVTLLTPGFLKTRNPELAAALEIAKTIIDASDNDDDDKGSGPGGGGADSGVIKLKPRSEPPESPSGPPAAYAIFRGVRARWIGLAMALSLVLPGCSWFTKEHVRDARDTTRAVLTVLQNACILANANFPKPVIKKVCKIVDTASDVDQALDDLLSSANSAGFTPARSYPVSCEETDGGVILCTKRFDEGAP